MRSKRGSFKYHVDEYLFRRIKKTNFVCLQLTAISRQVVSFYDKVPLKVSVHHIRITVSQSQTLAPLLSARYRQWPL
jgi:hypothetical protein